MSKKVTIFDTEEDGRRAIVASNLVLVSAIIGAARKTETGRSPSLSDAIEEAVKAFKSCASSLKKVMKDGD